MAKSEAYCEAIRDIAADVEREALWCEEKAREDDCYEQDQQEWLDEAQANRDAAAAVRKLLED